MTSAALCANGRRLADRPCILPAPRTSHLLCATPLALLSACTTVAANAWRSRRRTGMQGHHIAHFYQRFMHALHLMLLRATAGRGQVAEYLTGGRGRAKSGALASAASPAPSLAALTELAPLLAAVAPDLARGLVSRVSARFLRELYVP